MRSSNNEGHGIANNIIEVIRVNNDKKKVK